MSENIAVVAPMLNQQALLEGRPTFSESAMTIKNFRYLHHLVWIFLSSVRMVWSARSQPISPSAGYRADRRAVLRSTLLRGDVSPSTQCRRHRSLLLASQRHTVTRKAGTRSDQTRNK